MAITPTRRLGQQGVQQLLNVQTLAATGSTITDAALIKTKSPAIVFATGANATVGVKLPKAVPGKWIRIKNRDSDNAVLNVYPFESTTVINAIAAGSPIAMAAKTSADFTCVAGGSSGQWVTSPLLPS